MPTLPQSFKRRKRPLTARNVFQDIKETAYDIRDESEEVPSRLRERIEDYQDRHVPDINRPVPLPIDFTGISPRERDVARYRSEDARKRGLRHVKLK